jgi:hypothetical protein
MPFYTHPLPYTPSCFPFRDLLYPPFFHTSGDGKMAVSIGFTLDISAMTGGKGKIIVGKIERLSRLSFLLLG